MSALKQLISVRSIRLNQWARGHNVARHHRRQLSMMVSGTWYSSRSWRPILTPRFIGNHRMETFLEQTPYVDRACRLFKPLENLGLKLSVTKIIVYPVHDITRKSLGLMMRKLSVTESQSSAQFRGTFSRRKPSVASANWAQVA